MTTSWAIERRDFKRIEKLNKLNNKQTFWDDVRKLAKGGDHTLSRWQCLAEERYKELKEK